MFFLVSFWNLANAPIDCGHAPVRFGITGSECSGFLEVAERVRIAGGLLRPLCQIQRGLIQQRRRTCILRIQLMRVMKDLIGRWHFAKIE